MSKVVLTAEQIEQLRAVWNDPNSHLAMELNEKQASLWQPIESAPKDGTRVLLWTDTRSSVDLHLYFATGGEHFSMVQIGQWEEAVNSPMQTQEAGWRTSMVGEPTHWMPLPAAPGSDPGIPVYATSPGGNLQAPE